MVRTMNEKGIFKTLFVVTILKSENRVRSCYEVKIDFEIKSF